MNFNQPQLISSLLQKGAYNHPTSKIKVEETHISWIVLTGKYAYKLKKEIKFGKVLDFTTLQLRQLFCHKEVILNRILCRDMYKGVVKIVRLNESDQCGNNDNNDFKVQIVGLRQKAVALDYAVKMRQISQRFRMDNLVAANKVELKTIEKLAHILVEFHHFTPTNITIKYFGSPKYIRKKVLENFETLRKLYDHSKNSNDDDDNDNAITISKLENKLISFIAGNKSLFNKRISENKVRDIHGDLYMKNIFIPQKNTVYLYDRIEFNDYLRYADVAEDVAHLCMDMDYHRISKLKKHFLSCYINESNDFELKLVLPFLMCYKACVRAKVSAFKARNERNTKVKARCLREARDHLELAQSYHELF